MLVDIVSKGGNLLLNIGPGPDGNWHEEAYERLEEIGNWMEINQSAIYNSHGKEQFGSDKIRYTYLDDGSMHVIYLADEGEKEMPHMINADKLNIKAISEIHLLGSEYTLGWEKSGKSIMIFIPDELRKNRPCDFAWVFKIVPGSV
jgi:alpha-L-fucosidase